MSIAQRLAAGFALTLVVLLAPGCCIDCGCTNGCAMGGGCGLGGWFEPSCGCGGSYCCEPACGIADCGGCCGEPSCGIVSGCGGCCGEPSCGCVDPCCCEPTCGCAGPCCCEPSCGLVASCGCGEPSCGICDPCGGGCGCGSCGGGCGCGGCGQGCGFGRRRNCCDLLGLGLYTGWGPDHEAYAAGWRDCFNPFFSALGCAGRSLCGGGCGSMYWDEWGSDPPCCCDPCCFQGPARNCGMCKYHPVNMAQNCFDRRRARWAKRGAKYCDCGECQDCYARSDRFYNGQGEWDQSRPHQQVNYDSGSRHSR